jgi:uncharacterized protein (UPF0332 family)
MKDENIAYRIKRAHESCIDAEVLYKMGSINSSINRLYYPAFYANLAQLLDNNIEVKSHKGVKQKLGEEFVLKGLIAKDLAKTYSILLDYRHKGDYDDLFETDQKIVENLFDPVKEYIDKIESLLSP